MKTSKWERYVVRKPVYEAVPGVKNRQSPAMTFMSNRQVPEANYYIELGWVYNIPVPNPHIHEHIHDFDEVILYWGGNPYTPQVLGGEIEFYIGGQSVTFNTTTSMFIPKGTPHGPVTWRKFQFPHVEMILALNNGNPLESLERSSINKPNKGALQKTINFDYEQYAIRSPMREAALGFRGLQSPSMTYMSSVQINAANLYIDWAWVYDIVKPRIGEHVHHNNEEIVLHIGGDPDNPEDLGADMEYGLGGDLLQYNTSYAIFIPKGLRHGPLNWKKVRKPHVEMAIVFGIGTFKERSEGSSFIRS